VGLDHDMMDAPDPFGENAPPSGNATDEEGLFVAVASSVRSAAVTSDEDIDSGPSTTGGLDLGPDMDSFGRSFADLKPRTGRGGGAGRLG
jgi:hypothetical protein